MAINKIRNSFVEYNIENSTQNNRGGEAHSPSSSLGTIANVRTLVDTKWIALSAAFTSSNLNGFTQSTGILTCTDTRSKNYIVFGQVSCYADVDTQLRMAVAKNGAILSGSEVQELILVTGSASGAKQINLMSRVTLVNTDTVALQLISNLTGANIYAKTATLVVHQ
jgi:hypothetical protein